MPLDTLCRQVHPPLLAIFSGYFCFLVEKECVDHSYIPYGIKCALSITSPVVHSLIRSYVGKGKLISAIVD